MLEEAFQLYVVLDEVPLEHPIPQWRIGEIGSGG